MSEATEFEKLVESRRSVRLFDSTPVPESVIQKSLDLALRAPNSSNLQPWEFYWVKTPSIKSELVKACLSQAAAATAAELMVCVGRTETWRLSCAHMLEQLEWHEKNGTRIPPAAFHYYRKQAPLMYSQGFLGTMGYLKRSLFFLQSLKKPVMRTPASHHEMQIWAVKSTALACENLMLAIRSHGFDSCPMEGFDSVRVKKLLKLPSDAIILMVLGIGKRRPKGVTLPHIRRDRSNFVKLV